jgi:hypothetical protein
MKQGNNLKLVVSFIGACVLASYVMLSNSGSTAKSSEESAARPAKSVKAEPVESEPQARIDPHGQINPHARAEVAEDVALEKAVLAAAAEAANAAQPSTPAASGGSGTGGDMPIDTGAGAAGARRALTPEDGSAGRGGPVMPDI